MWRRGKTQSTTDQDQDGGAAKHRAPPIKIKMAV